MSDNFPELMHFLEDKEEIEKKNESNVGVFDFLFSQNCENVSMFLIATNFQATRRPNFRDKAKQLFPAIPSRSRSFKKSFLDVHSKSCSREDFCFLLGTFYFFPIKLFWLICVQS